MLCETPEGKGIATGAALEQVGAGQVLVARGLVDAADCRLEMQQAWQSALVETLGAEQAARVPGPERVHEHVPLDEIGTLNDALYRAFESLCMPLATTMLRDVFGYRGLFFVEKRPNARLHVPFDLQAPARQTLVAYARKQGFGKISAHGPHRDHWLDCPHNCLNVWIALGRVRRGNGLSIYPGRLDDRIAHDKVGHVFRAQALGAPQNFELEPGDAVLFLGRHVHASEINATDETRAAVSFRLTLGRPRFVGPSSHQYRGSDGSERRGPRKSRWRRWAARIRPKPEPPSEAAPRPIETLRPGDVAAIGPDRCAARLADGRLVQFARRCPHEGADLAQGHLQGDSIVCPWHNLRFSAATGESPCRALTLPNVSPQSEEGPRA
ncbi:MAG: Rieske 2Fe-2S domain-containing protein [Proteobacteria bacterium]|nr:Rieske 2Fe-2S domain-containing protein [Pseudomonadota bacterium]